MSAGDTRQLWPVCACAHSEMPTMATRVHGTHTTSLRTASARGSVSTAHTANSCQGSAPVW